MVYACAQRLCANIRRRGVAQSVFSGIQTCAQWLVGLWLSGFALDFTHHTDGASAAAIAASPAALRVRWGASVNRAVFRRCWTGLFRR